MATFKKFEEIDAWKLAREFEKLKTETENSSGMLQGLMNYLNKSELKGVKFKARV